MEDTGIPRIFRNTHVHCIWEGTTTVMAHDVLRALRSEQAANAFVAEVEAKARSYDHPLTADAARTTLAALEKIKPMLAAADEADGRRLAWSMARTYQAALLCDAAGWALDKHGDDRTASALRLLTAEPLVGPEPAISADEASSLAFGV